MTERMPSRPERRIGIFDRWATDYDRSVDDMARAEAFPFAGYERVLHGVCRLAAPTPGMNVLDLGTGTGSLARRLLDLGGHVWGTDFSPKMLEAARARIPEATLVEAMAAAEPAGLRGDWHPVSVCAGVLVFVPVR